MKNKILTTCAIATFSLATFAANACDYPHHRIMGHEHEDAGLHDSVRSSSNAAFSGGAFSGDVIKNTWNNCVVTKWVSNLGVSDSTMSGSGVQKPNGCDEQIKQVINMELLHVYFDFDSALLTPVAKDKLDQVVDLLRSSQHINSIDLVGYTDSFGSNDYNYALSQRRAEAVRQYIAAQGYLKTEKVSVQALGAENPVSDCKGGMTSELKSCLWRDRRVELQLNFID